MQPTASPETIVTTNVVGDVAVMDIRAEAKAHIMDVLSKALYSEPVYAVIREYSTNALDAHVEAGNPAPIEVSLPNDLKPVFRVKDFGTGLSVDDIHEIYSQYGISTKRDSNDYNGYLGLGCKSAFAYTDQFTVTSVKDGAKITVMVARNEDGSGEMTTVDTRATTDPNGTEVSVPVENAHEFRKWATHLFRFWPEGSVLVNGEAPERIDGLKLTDDILIVDGNQDYIVMGNVPYPVDLGFEMTEKAIVAFIPNGSAEFMTSREALKMTAPSTKATVADVQEKFNNGVRLAVQTALDSAKSGPEALATLNQWQRSMPRLATGDGFRFKQRVIPTSMPVDVEKAKVIVAKPDAWKLKDHNVLHQAYSRASWPKTIWITGFDQGFTSVVKKKLEHWVAENKLWGWNHALFLPGKMPRDVKPWIEKSMIVSWETLKAIKLPRKGNEDGGGRKTGSYDCWIAGKREFQVTADEINTDEPLFYSVGDLNDAHKFSLVLTNAHPNCTIVTFYQNREAKFRREFPDAIPAQEGAQEAYDNWVRKLSRKDRLALIVKDMNGASTLKTLDHKKIEDPELVFAIKLVKRDTSKIEKEGQRFNRIMGRINTQGKLKWSNPLNKYPLVENTWRVRDYMDHLYIYINAVYAANPSKES